MPFTMSPEVADRLLDKLSSDEEFRSLFQTDAREALKQVGHAGALSDAQEGLWMCTPGSELADMHSIRQARDVLRRQLVSSKAEYSVIKLQVGD